MNDTRKLGMDIVRDSLQAVKEKTFGNNQWGQRHFQGWQEPAGFERGLVLMIRGWVIYADNHHTRYESSIGDDGVLGPGWAGIGKSLLALLNSELGRMDGGTLDALIRDILKNEGLDPDNL